MEVRPTVRIWDKKLKRWLDNGNSLHAFSHYMLDAFTGDVINAIGEYDGDHHDHRHNRRLDFEPDCYVDGVTIVHDRPFVVCKSTGLKDKNGTPIYEGDLCYVVYHVTHGPQEEGTVQCFWSEQFAGFLFGVDELWTVVELQSIEVVGNIFESKDPDNG